MKVILFYDIKKVCQTYFTLLNYKNKVILFYKLKKTNQYPNYFHPFGRPNNLKETNYYDFMVDFTKIFA